MVRGPVTGRTASSPGQQGSTSRPDHPLWRVEGQGRGARPASPRHQPMPRRDPPVGPAHPPRLR
jgi:hypothetical protein